MKFWKMVKMRLLRRQAERGNVEAMTSLAVDHMDLQNFDEATRWFRKAADLGFPDAQLMLGSAYDAGKGVAKDSVEAVRWYRRAAEQGNTSAQSIVGGMYLTGDGVEKNGSWQESGKECVLRGFLDFRRLLGFGSFGY